jgi:hypothetical protein
MAEVVDVASRRTRSRSSALSTADIACRWSDTGEVRVAAPLLPIFRSRLQGELLALVLVDPARSWTIDELSQRTAQPYQTVATEVRRLHDSGLFTMTAVGRAKLLSANESKPYVRPLTQLVLMAFGPPLVIGEELAKVVGSSSCSSTARGAARYYGEPGSTPNDIDVLVRNVTLTSRPSRPCARCDSVPVSTTGSAMERPSRSVCQDSSATGGRNDQERRLHRSSGVLRAPSGATCSAA